MRPVCIIFGLWLLFPGLPVNEIHLSHTLYEAMLAHLTSCLPEEACGLVSGTVAGGHCQAVRLFPIENRLHSPVAYEMEPLQQIQAMIAIENEGMEMAAIYHSHPDGPARPSWTDVTQAYYPEAATIIVSLADRDRPSMNAFMIQEGRVREIAVIMDVGR